MRRRLSGVVVGLLLLLVLSCGVGAAATRTNASTLPSFRIHMGSAQLTIGPTRFARCAPSWIGSRCEELPDVDRRTYYAVALHYKTNTAGLWRERSRWIIALPF
jgi:hypothetical protein